MKARVVSRRLYPKFCSLISSKTNAQVSGLAEGEFYTFYVQAVNAYGTSGASSPLTVVAALASGVKASV